MHAFIYPGISNIDNYVIIMIKATILINVGMYMYMYIYIEMLSPERRL